MGCQLFLHHHFPVLYLRFYFTVPLSVTSAVRPKIQLQIAAVLLIISIMTILEVRSSGVWRSLDEKEVHET
jgi:hypothetical protein